MKIWILNQYASPPDAPSTGAYFLAEELVKRGHDITFFASSFNYYKLKDIRTNENNKILSDYNGVKFLWIKTFKYDRNNWRRAFNMLSYGIKAFFKGIFLEGKPDVIIGTCPHPLAVLSAYMLSICKGSKFVYEVRDIWPQTLVDEGLVTDKNLLVIIFKALEKFLFNRACKILTVLPALGKYTSTVGIDDKKIVWVPNGIDLSRINTSDDYTGVLKDPFKVMYIGGHSNYQGLETVLKSAEIMLQNNENVKFLFIGDGARKKDLFALKEAKNLTNVEFIDSVPREEVYSLMREADCMLFHIKVLSILKYGISSNKLCDYMVSKRPIIFAAITGNNPIEASGAGITIQPENAEEIVEAIKKIKALSPEERKSMGEKALEFVKNNYDIKALADKFEEGLLSCRVCCVD